MPTHQPPTRSAKSLMPVTTDALLLAEFVALQPAQRILDLGAGAGAIALALCGRETVEVVGVDNCFEALEEARLNLERERELLRGSVEFIAGDLRNDAFLDELGAFDQVVCNPPYYKLGEGRIPPSQPRAAARHEITCTFEEVVRAASRVMPPQGVFSFLQVPARLGEVLALLPVHGLNVEALRPVYTRQAQDARLVLFRAVKGANGAPRMLPALQLRTLADG